jgi:predicted helicase
VAAVFLKPTRANQWRFVPHDDANQDEWVVFTALPDVFVSWGAGVLTNRNGLAVADSRGELLRKVRRFADLTIGDAEIEADYGFASNYQWATGKARRDFARHPVKDLTEPYTFRPFDFQYIYWHKNIVYNMRGDKMEVFRTKTPPLGLMFSRNTKHGQYTNVYVTRRIPDRHCLEEANVAALHTVASADELFSGHRISLHCNLSEVFLAKVREHFASDGEAPTPDTILNYMYAVLHSPGYRSRYAAFLKIDFPHLPLPHGLDLFRSVASFGDEIVALHLMESPSLSKHITKWVADKSSDVEKVSYSDKTVWIDRARTTGFRGVPEHVWNFHIGGYQVCEKWLKDRKGRALSADDIEHYQKVVVALSETIRIMGEIDMVIEKHGGWPGAFVTEKVDLGVS